jgi:hypothetical protein
MKKTIRKLVVRRDTVRVLRELNARELARVDGGNSTDCPDRQLAESDKVNCPLRAE